VIVLLRLRYRKRRIATDHAEDRFLGASFIKHKFFIACNHNVDAQSGHNKNFQERTWLRATSKGRRSAVILGLRSTVNSVVRCRKTKFVGIQLPSVRDMGGRSHSELNAQP